jgi:hypothetical protein
MFSKSGLWDFAPAILSSSTGFDKEKGVQEMKTRYYMLEIREMNPEIIELGVQAPALPQPQQPETQPEEHRSWLGMWMDVAASLAIVGMCVAFWLEVVL